MKVTCKYSTYILNFIDLSCSEIESSECEVFFGFVTSHFDSFDYYVWNIMHFDYHIYASN